MSIERPVRLLIVVPPTYGGGVELGLSILLNGLDRELVRPSVALTHSRSRNQTLMPAIPADVEVIELDKRGLLDQRRVVRDLRAYYDTYRPDVVVGKATYANVLALLARREARFSPAVVATEHTNPATLHRPRTLWLLWAARRLYPQAVAVLGVGRDMAGAVAQEFRISPSSVRVIRNAYHTAEDAVLDVDEPLDPPLPADLAQVVYVGRLSPEKGLDDLLRAVQIVRRNKPVRLTLIGDGPLRNGLEAVAAQLGLADVVSFLGFVPHPYRYMAAAGVFVLPSHSEASPTVLMEAMRSGAAIVAADCDYGPRELISHERDGLLVPVGNSLALAAAILRVLTEPGLGARLRTEAHRSSERHAPSRMVSEYQRLILEVAGRTLELAPGEQPGETEISAQSG